LLSESKEGPGRARKKENEVLGKVSVDVEGCKPENIITTPDGIKVCSTNGMVISDSILDDRPEWRYYPSKGEKKGLERSSKPLTFSQHDGGVGAELRVRRKKFYNLSRIRQMRKRRYKAPVQRSEIPLINTFSLMHKIVAALNLPRAQAYSILEMAGTIIRKYFEERRTRGEEANKTTIISKRERAAVTIVALRKALSIHNLPIGENELYAAASLEVPEANTPEFKNYVWKITMRMNEYGIHTIPKIGRQVPGIKARLNRIETFVVRLLAELGLPMSLRLPTMKFLEAVAKAGKSLWGRRPEAVAAAAVYLIARLNGYERVTQKLVASVYNLSEANVRKTFRYLIEDIVIIVGL